MEETNLTPDLESEINTYDLPPLSPDETAEPTKCFNRSVRRRHGALYKIYAVIAVSILLLTLIFAAGEVYDFIMDDLGTRDMFIRRIFGYGEITNKDGGELADMILRQAFFNLSPKESEPPAVTDPFHEHPPPPVSTQAPIEPETPKETEIEAPPQTPSVTDPVETPAPTPSGKPIISMDMSLLSYGKDYIYNDTSLSPNIGQLLQNELKSYYTPDSDEPLVLIIHTHATESFMPEGTTHYDDSGEIARSDDIRENMVAVGAEFARVLNENGIPTLHCEILHDAESYRLSYERSAETIARYLEEYPSIKYIFDLHRDSLMRSTGELISAVSSVNGKNHAQIMPVVGSGFRGYEGNLTLALKLREKLNGEYTNLCRPVCLRESVYNQNLAPVSLLLEMGTSGNTLAESKASAVLVADALAKLIKE